MKTFYFLFIGLILINSKAQSQHKWVPFESLIGQWNGTGTAASGNTSTVKTSFEWVMNGQYLEVKNESVLNPPIKIRREKSTPIGV